jgi:hypothetical protein
MSVLYYGMVQQSNEDYGRGLDRVARVELLGYAVV